MEQPNVSRIERGDRGVAWDIAVRWLEACGKEVTITRPGVSTVVLPDAEQHELSAIRALLIGWSGMSPEARRIVVATISAAIPT